jgi:outer membrane protein OmpA-like peptidoglycan-associated protein
LGPRGRARRWSTYFPWVFKTTSYGEELPLCKDSTENCYEKNRRDRFVEVRGRSAS